jgi:hypothetical protein
VVEAATAHEDSKARRTKIVYPVLQSLKVNFGLPIAKQRGSRVTCDQRGESNFHMTAGRRPLFVFPDEPTQRRELDVSQRARTITTSVPVQLTR